MSTPSFSFSTCYMNKVAFQVLLRFFVSFHFSSNSLCIKYQKDPSSQNSCLLGKSTIHNILYRKDFSEAFNSDSNWKIWFFFYISHIIFLFFIIFDHYGTQFLKINLTREQNTIKALLSALISLLPLLEIKFCNAIHLPNP